jgi:hypothetical protein
LNGFKLSPQVIESSRNGEIALVFPPKVCGRFGGKRIRARGLVAMREDHAVGILIWKGDCKLNGSRFRAGDELFASADAMRNCVEIENLGDELCEIFTFFPTP